MRKLGWPRTCLTGWLWAVGSLGFAQNPLLIPDTLSGTTIQLTVGAGTQTFFPGFTTPTYGYNGDFLGPTLLLHTGDSVQMQVTNTLNTATTVHWHGFHVAPHNDGGPHQVITAGSTWSPAFKIRNPASTLWYHPHGEGRTELQVTRGLAGMAIIRDAVEATYGLPRHYGVDDFPLILQSKAFDVAYQFAIASHEDSIMLVNGTLDPYLDVPAQVVRFRVLNGSTDRTYLLGLSDNAPLYLIASDGGLLSQPLTMQRVRISPGERVELLVPFGGYPVGHQVALVSYASELPRGIIGADSVGTSAHPIGEGYYSNPLNGLDFTLVDFHVTAPTANPVTAIPAAFAPVVPLDTIGLDMGRHISLSADTAQFGASAEVDGPFFIMGVAYNADSINIRTLLGNKEVWTLTNSTKVAHPFHIHDIQFTILDINGSPPPPQYAGWKDVILVMPGDTVRFVGKFETFADDSMPYMYHCHLLHHEDEGMMGQFLVMNPATGLESPPSGGQELRLYPNPASERISLDLPPSAPGRRYRVIVVDALGHQVHEEWLQDRLDIDLRGLPAGLYHLRVTGDRANWIGKFVKM